MTAAPTGTNDARRVRRALGAAVLLGAALAAVAYLLLREEAPGTGADGRREGRPARGRAREPAGARRWRGAHRAAAGVSRRQPLDRCAGRALRSRRRTRIRRLAALPAPGLRRDRRAERRAQGCPRATERRRAACGAQGSRAGDGRARSAGRSRRRAADPVLHAALRAAAPHAGWRRLRRDQDPPVQIEVVGPRLAPSRRPAAGARGRRVARPGRRRAGAAALCRAALGLRHRPETHPLRDRHAVSCAAPGEA